MEETQVETVPPTPIAPVKYLVSYNEKDPLSSVSDNWNWGRSQPCKRKGFSVLEEGGPFRFVGDRYSVQIQSVHFKK